MLCSFTPLESDTPEERNVKKRRPLDMRTKVKASPFLMGFTTRCHNFIWFLIFTFTLYCMPNYELLFPYKIHFGLPEAEAAETTEQTQAQAADTSVKAESEASRTTATTESVSTNSTGTTATTSEGSSGDIGSSGQTSPTASFKVDDFTGAAHLSYPIAIPPARSGLSPQLSLNYVSSGGNGWIGVGWGLSVGSIQRKGPRRGVPKYNNTNDVYELNIGGAPQELVPIGNDEYRLKIEGAYFKVQYYSAGNYWMVWDKSGIKMTFGSTVNSRIGKVRDPNVKNETLGWCLDRAEDPKTNYMELIYFRDQDTDNTYQIYLQEIRYNAQVSSGLPHNHRVLFNLESSDRPDPIYNYRGGFKMLTRKRLSSIEIRTNESLVRRYQLQYTVSNTRSLLSSITPYGNDNTSTLPPTTFTYQTHSLSFQNSVTWLNPSTREIPDGSGGTFTIGRLIRDTSLGTLTDVLDINGDGLVERVVYDYEEPYDTWGVYHNTFDRFVAQPDGTPWAWANPSAWGSVDGNYIRNSPYIYGEFTEVIDMNGDGFPDRAVYSKDCTSPYTNCPWSVYFNNGINGFDNVTEPNWPNPSAWGSQSGNYIRSSNGLGTYADVVDMNGDGLPDRVVHDRITPNNWLVYFNNGAGFDQAVNWPNATGYIRSNLVYNEFSFTNADIIDMNGDGLPDRVVYDGSKWLVYFNNGAGFDPGIEWPNATNYIRLSISDDGFTYTTRDLFDINGDGLPDQVVWGSPWTVYLNNGSGFGPGITWNNASGFIKTNSQMGTVADNFDINGDGLVDRVGANPYPYLPTDWSVSFNNGPAPDLLSSMVNSIGGSIEITYRPSTEYDNTASDGKWHLPFPVWTVASYVQKDGRGNSYLFNYDYAGGYYYSDSTDVEFRGFRNVTAYQMADSQSYESKTVTEFYQDYYLKGRVKTQTLTSKEGHTKYIVNNWLLADTLGGGKFPYLDTVTTTVTDQGAVGPFSYSYTTKDFYDIRPSDQYYQTFNLLKEHKNVGTPEEIVTSLEYTSDYTHWILSKPTKITVTDANGIIASRKWMDYNAFGELTKEELCNSMTPGTGGCDNPNPDQNVFTYYYYDPTYKVLNQVIDPRGYPTTITYDSTKTHVYESTKCIDGGKCFTTKTEYDPGTGNLIKLVPPYLEGTDYWFQTQYDVFGRKILDRLKDNSDPNAPPIVDRGSTSYAYNDFGNPNGQYILKTGRIVIEGAPERTLTLNGATYFDGLGRTYLAMANGPEGKTIAIQTVFDNIGRVWKQSKPYFYGSETPYFVETTYDGFSRATDVKKLDGYYVHTAYQGLKKVVSKQASASVWHSTAYTYDLNQKLRMVEEDYNVSTGSSYSSTHYVYDILGNLTQVRAAKDASGNNLLGSSITTTMTYDSLLKKRSMNDPDMGYWTYEYDKMGNLIKQIDAKNQMITFDYDGLNRLWHKYYPDHTVTFTYDDPSVPNSKGMLTKVSDPSGGELKEDRVTEYDLMQRVTKSSKKIGADEVSFEKKYDSAGRVVSITYPGSKTYSYEYDVAGDLLYVKDSAGNHLVDYSDFTALGQHKVAAFPKPDNVSIKTTYTYDLQTARLKTLLTQRLVGANPTDTYQNLDYQQFDGKGNIITLIDNKNSITHSYAYDALNRLTSANGNNGTTYSQTYQYDLIGNITYKSNFGAGSTYSDITYTYNYSNKPHAVRSVATDMPVYNDPVTTIVYNFDNKPTSITKGSTAVLFTYDGNGQRVRKQSSVSGTTTYFGGLYEVRGGVETIHIFAGGQRIASVLADGRTQFYHANHLGSASVITDQIGGAKEQIEYLPFGEYRAPGETNGTIDYDTNFPDVFYTFTGQEDDDDLGLYNYGARLYDPLLGRFISPDRLVPDPVNPQSLNRYAYCLNNPLIYTDPSGEDFFAIIFSFIWSIVSSEIFISVAGGAALGAATSAITGGNIWQGALTGAISGLLFYGAGTLYGITMSGAEYTVLQQVATRFIIHAIAGAVSGAINAAITGSDPRLGILTGAVGAGIGALAGGGLQALGLKASEYQLVGRVVAGGLAGGVVSEIYGGNFWQGAAQGAGTAAAAFLFNECMDKKSESGVPIAAGKAVEQAVQAAQQQGYVDLNFSFPVWKILGITFGFINYDQGKTYYSYIGGGVITSFSVSLTGSPYNVTTGWNVAAQYTTAPFSGQLGYAFGKGGGLYWELGPGIGDKGLAVTGFYIWKW
jgi:RHS repeat-associated protein